MNRKVTNLTDYVQESRMFRPHIHELQRWRGSLNHSIYGNPERTMIWLVRAKCYTLGSWKYSIHAREINTLSSHCQVLLRYHLNWLPSDTASSMAYPSPYPKIQLSSEHSTSLYLFSMSPLVWDWNHHLPTMAQLCSMWLVMHIIASSCPLCHIWHRWRWLTRVLAI